MTSRLISVPVCAPLESNLPKLRTKKGFQMLKIAVFSLSLILVASSSGGCNSAVQSNDSKIAQQQEQQLAEGDAQVAPPAITNWTEKRMMKLIQEKRDTPNLPTWTYTKNMDGKYTFVCESFGYGLPYNTRSNNPQHYEFVSTASGVRGNGSYSFLDPQGNPYWGEHAIMAQPEPKRIIYSGLC